MNQNARTAVRIAAERKARRIAYWTSAALVAAAVIASAWVTAPDREMTQPPAHTFVVAWTVQGHWYKAYLDDDGEFKDPETGMPIGQVTKWMKP